VAATNQELPSLMTENKFRSDFYSRLAVFPISLPPLRQRREDICLLVRHFVHRAGKQMNKHITKIPAASMAALECYHWRGNIRELPNIIERAAILT
jgi:formate hydrogenlyase transcriptional activator